jgi:hypothetical protein
VFIVRITVALLLIATFVLVAAYIVSRNKNYLVAIKRLYKYAAWFAIVIILLTLISRVIKL